MKNTRFKNILNFILIIESPYDFCNILIFIGVLYPIAIFGMDTSHWFRDAILFQGWIAILN